MKLITSYTVGSGLVCAEECGLCFYFFLRFQGFIRSNLMKDYEPVRFQHFQAYLLFFW
jgi:hypothetical protein